MLWLFSFFFCQMRMNSMRKRLTYANVCMHVYELFGIIQTVYVLNFIFALCLTRLLLLLVGATAVFVVFSSSLHSFVRSISIYVFVVCVCDIILLVGWLVETRFTGWYYSIIIILPQTKNSKTQFVSLRSFHLSSLKSQWSNFRSKLFIWNFNS